MTLPVALRPAQAADLAFCRRIEHETMRWIVDELFGWDEARRVENFARKWRVEEVRIITVAAGDGWQDAGWLQTALRDDAIFLKAIYLDAVPAAGHRYARDADRHRRGAAAIEGGHARGRQDQPGAASL